MRFAMSIALFAAGSLAAVITSNIVAESNRTPDYRPMYDQLPQESSRSIQIPVIPYENIVPQESTSPPTSPPVKNKSVIRIVKTGDNVSFTKDPIWKVILMVNNKEVESTNALIGRANRQTANRHTSGNKSPLPLGTYSIDTSGIEMGPFGDPEVGRGYWVPISPLFNTRRSELGIHHDPSWGKNNGESGTSGCVGLRTVDDTKKVVNWIRKYNVRSLVVES